MSALIESDSGANQEAETLGDFLISPGISRAAPERVGEGGLYVEDHSLVHVKQHAELGVEGMTPMYHMSLITVEGSGRGAAKRGVCIIVPPGREHEYIFNAEEGLRDLLRSAGDPDKMTLIKHSRAGSALGYEYPADAAETTELFRAVVEKVMGDYGQVPIMSLGECTPRSILMQDEDSIIEETKDGAVVTRRLFFKENQNVVQSATFMVGGEALKLRVEFEYHKEIAAAAVCLGRSAFGSNISEPKAVVIGLGGGALSMFLESFLGIPIETLELCQNVVDIAKEYFMFSGNTRIMNGLDYDYGTGSVSVAVIDVDSKDQTVGMSCPPLDFVKSEYLKKIRFSLKEGGVLCINVSARNRKLLGDVVKVMKDVFEEVGGSVYVSASSDEDLNVVVIGRNKKGTEDYSRERNMKACELYAARALKENGDKCQSGDWDLVEEMGESGAKIRIAGTDDDDE